MHPNTCLYTVYVKYTKRMLLCTQLFTTLCLTAVLIHSFSTIYNTYILVQSSEIQRKIHIPVSTWTMPVCDEDWDQGQLQSFQSFLGVYSIAKKIIF